MHLQCALGALVAQHIVDRLCHAVHRFGDHRQQRVPCAGQRQSLRPALEQGRAEQRLQTDHVAADGALGHAEGMSAGGETEVLADRLEGSERVQRQPAPVDRLPRHRIIVLDSHVNTCPRARRLPRVRSSGAGAAAAKHKMRSADAQMR
jgi:hypothetical protein